MDSWEARQDEIHLDHRIIEDILEVIYVYPLEKKLTKCKHKMVESCWQDGRHYTPETTSWL
jgi:hypothetical protein